LAASALVGASLSLSAGLAHAGEAGWGAMPLGAAAPAPAGYLAFCARTPDQCAIQPVRDAQGVVLSGDALAKSLYARYYWRVAFGGAAMTSPPSSGYGAPAAAADASGRYDWSRVFGATDAPAAPQAQPVQPASAPAKPDETTGADKAGDPPRKVWASSAERTAPAFPSLATLGGWRFGRAALFDHRTAYDVASLDFGFAGAAAPAAGSQPTDAWTWRGGDAVAFDFSTAPAARGEAEPTGKALSTDRVKTADLQRPAKGAAAADPTDFEAAAGPVQPLATTHALLSLLDKVNLGVNRAIRYVPDQQLYGDEDYWHLALTPGGKAEGDCKDYVLEKRRALIAAGVPTGALSIAIARTGWGETHAVLLVSTDKGELVLDSLSSWVQPWTKVRYQWMERQAPGRQLSWVSIG